MVGKKKLLLKKTPFLFFSTEERRWVEELFAYIFGIYIKFGYKNPSILAPTDSVAVAT